MKYTTEVRIRLPRSKVIALFDSTEHIHKWQPGLKSMEHVSGQPGQKGARSRMIYEGRKGDLEMTETITKRNFPGEFFTTYEAKGVYNEMCNYFVEEEANLTLWRTESLFKFRGLMALMAPFMKSAFTSNTLLSMERFRDFAERFDSEQERKKK